jgi:hypothetical protein
MKCPALVLVVAAAWAASTGVKLALNKDTTMTVMTRTSMTLSLLARAWLTSSRTRRACVEPTLTSARDALVTQLALSAPLERKHRR